MPRRIPGSLVLAAALALNLTACGSSAKTGTGDTPASSSVPYGGTIVIGAEQEPDCFDWIGAVLRARSGARGWRSSRRSRRRSARS